MVVAIQTVTREFVIEADVVVAEDAGLRLTEFGMDPGHELRLAVTLLVGLLRGNPGNEAGLRIG